MFVDVFLTCAVCHSIGDVRMQSTIPLYILWVENPTIRATSIIYFILQIR